MNFWEAVTVIIIAIFCTPLGWIGMLVLGMIIQMLREG